MTGRGVESPGFGSPFDAVAPEYDGGFGRSAAGRVFRFRLAERVVASMPPRASLLDVGAGTGEDAAWFAAQGYEVVGIDPSGGMLDVAIAKTKAMSHPPRFIRVGLAEFEPLARFDGVYSDFGAMNCVPLSRWRGAFERIVAPGGRLLLVLMGRRPLPEALRLGREAWVRRSGGTARVGDGEISVEYPGPGEVVRALGPAFRLDRTESMGALVPGPGMDQWPSRRPILFGMLAALESIVGRTKALCGYSDHYLIEFTRL